MAETRNRAAPANNAGAVLKADCGIPMNRLCQDRDNRSQQGPEDQGCVTSLNTFRTAIDVGKITVPIIQTRADDPESHRHVPRAGRLTGGGAASCGRLEFVFGVRCACPASLFGSRALFQPVLEADGGCDCERVLGW